MTSGSSLYSKVKVWKEGPCEVTYKRRLATSSDCACNRSLLRVCGSNGVTYDNPDCAQRCGYSGTPPTESLSSNHSIFSHIFISFRLFLHLHLVQVFKNAWHKILLTRFFNWFFYILICNYIGICVLLTYAPAISCFPVLYLRSLFRKLV